MRIESVWHGVVAVGIAAGFNAGAIRAAPAFTNAGFEDNGPAYNTGYNTFKSPIAGWTLTGSGGNVGVMYNGEDAFTGGSGYTSQIVGIRNNRGISQTVSGFTPDQNYVVVWEGNIRNQGVPRLTVIADGRIVWSDALARNAGAFLSYTSRPFTATSGEMTISFNNFPATDETVLLDNLQILETSDPIVSPFVDILPTTGGAVYSQGPDAYGITPYEGSHYLRLQNITSGLLTLRELQVGKSYRMSFYAINRSDGSPNDFRVSVNDTVYLGGPGHTIAGPGWIRQEFEFTATTENGALKFESLCTAGGDRTVGVDGFDIQETVLPLAIRALTPANLGPTNATLRGMLESTGGGENPEIAFCWGETTGGTVSTSDWSFVAGIGNAYGPAETFQLVIGGLSPGGAYHYRCYATNSTGSVWSDEQTFTAIYPAVITHTAMMVDSVWASVEGAVTDTGGEAPTVWLHVWPDGGSVTSVVPLGVQNAAFAKWLTGLSTSTTYSFAFLASNSAGLAWTETRTFTTYSTPSFANFGFEDDGPNYNTGFNSFKTPVSSWTVIGSSGDAGVMYFGNDAFTTGTGYKSQILGLRQGRGMAQALAGFAAGQRGVVVFEANTRGLGDCPLRITANDHVVWSELMGGNAGAFLSYTSRPFVAAGGTVTFSLIAPSPVDQTVLLDNLRILPTDQAVEPFVEHIGPLTGLAFYERDTYGVPPYEPPFYVRITGVGTATHMVRELRAGRRYLLSWFTRNRYAPYNAFQVRVDGTALVGGPDYTVDGTAWTNQTGTFTATGTSATLVFEGFTSGDHSIFFDAWTVELLPNPAGTLILIR